MLYFYHIVEYKVDHGYALHRLAEKTPRLAGRSTVNAVTSLSTDDLCRNNAKSMTRLLVSLRLDWRSVD